MDDEASLPIGFQARGGGADQRIGRGAQTHDDGVHVQHELAARHLHRAAASGRVGLTQLHFDTLHSGYASLAVGENPGGIIQKMKLDPFLPGVVDLLVPGGHLRFAAAVDHIYMLGTDALGTPGGVHGHVSAAHHGHGPAFFDGRVVFLQIGLHEIDTSEIFIGGVDPTERLAGDTHKHGQARARTHKYGLVALFKEFVDGDGLADDGIQPQLHAHIQNALHLMADNLLGQPELGNAVDQYATGGVEGLEDRDGIAQLAQVGGAGEPAGPEPTTATLTPLEAGLAVFSVPCSRYQSATKRSRRPMATGSPFLPRTHRHSHWLSWGQTRPEIAGGYWWYV